MTDELIDAVHKLLASKLFLGAPGELSAEGMVATYKILDLVEKMAQRRKKALRPKLLDHVAKHGRKTPKGHYTMSVGGHKILRETRKSKPNPEGVKDLLADKDLKALDAFDEVRTLVYNPSKVKHLIDVGKVEESEIEELTKPTWALKVTASKSLDEALQYGIPPSLEE